MFFNRQFNPIGLDISDKSLKLVQVHPTSHGLKLVSWNRISLPDCVLTVGEIKDEQKLIESIKRLINNAEPKIENNYVVVCLPETKTFIKLIEIETSDPNYPRNKLDGLIRQELPKHIPLPIEDIYLDWQVINKKKNRFEILIGVAPKEVVEKFSELLRKCDLMPVALEIEAQAIIRAIFPHSNDYSQQPLFSKEYNWRDILKTFKTLPLKKSAQNDVETRHALSLQQKKGLDNKTVYIIVDLGACRSGLIVWADKTIKFTSSLKTCGIDLTNLISQKLNLDARKAEKLKIIYGLTEKSNKENVKKILRPAIQELCDEILKAKEFYQTHFSGKDREYEIILTGGAANLIGLTEYMESQLQIKVSVADPTVNITKKGKDIIMPKEIQSYAAAIGLALRSSYIKDV